LQTIEEIFLEKYDKEGFSAFRKPSLIMNVSHPEITLHKK
jgi:hypothetical protein